MTEPYTRGVVVVFKDKAGEWRWHRRATNGQIVATSGEGYKNRTWCLEQAQKYNYGVEVEELE